MMILFGILVTVNVSTKKAAKLTAKEREEIIDDTTTIVVKQLVENCKPFVASFILFLSVSTILTWLFVYFYCKSKSRDVFIMLNKRAPNSPVM